MTHHGTSDRAIDGHGQREVEEWFIDRDLLRAVDDTKIDQRSVP
jgi:hypothetical protein